MGKIPSQLYFWLPIAGLIIDVGNAPWFGNDAVGRKNCPGKSTGFATDPERLIARFGPLYGHEIFGRCRGRAVELAGKSMMGMLI